MSSLNDIQSKALADVAAAEDAKQLEQLRVDYLGKKGQLTELLKGLGKLEPTERPKAGAAINQAKQEVQKAIAERSQVIEKEALTKTYLAEGIYTSNIMMIQPHKYPGN